MKKGKTLTLNIFSFFTYLIQVGVVLWALRPIEGFIRSFSHPGSPMYTNFFVFFNTVKPNTLGQNLLSDLNDIFNLILIVAIFLIMTKIRKIIKNIKHQHYFILANLKHLKSMLTAGSVMVISQIIQIIAFFPVIADTDPYASIWNLYHQGEFWLIEVVFLAMVYIIYRLFNSGLNLKKENNQFI